MIGFCFIFTMGISAAVTPVNNNSTNAFKGVSTPNRVASSHSSSLKQAPPADLALEKKLRKEASDINSIMSRTRSLAPENTGLTREEWLSKSIEMLEQQLEAREQSNNNAANAISDPNANPNQDFPIPIIDSSPPASPGQESAPPISPAPGSKPPLSSVKSITTTTKTIRHTSAPIITSHSSSFISQPNTVPLSSVPSPESSSVEPAPIPSDQSQAASDQSNSSNPSSSSASQIPVAGIVGAIVGSLVIIGAVGAYFFRKRQQSELSKIEEMKQQNAFKPPPKDMPDFRTMSALQSNTDNFAFPKPTPPKRAFSYFSQSDYMGEEDSSFMYDDPASFQEEYERSEISEMDNKERRESGRYRSSLPEIPEGLEEEEEVPPTESELQEYDNNYKYGSSEFYDESMNYGQDSSYDNVEEMQPHENNQQQKGPLYNDHYQDRGPRDTVITQYRRPRDRDTMYTLATSVNMVSEEYNPNPFPHFD